MKTYLEDLIKRKTAKIEELDKRSEASTDIAEVRAIGKTLKELRDEINEAEKKLSELKDDNTGDGGAVGEDDNPAPDERNLIPEGAVLRGAQVLVSFKGNSPSDDNIAYRTAFMNYMTRGIDIPAELRDNENTLTSDVGTVIPTELVNKIIEKVEETGTIIALVNKTNFAAGITIPVSTLKPVASWVDEGQSSDRQKKTTTKISFTYHKLRCEISVSMEVKTMALSAFEAKFTENVAKAMILAIEEAIINGDGNGKPEGILSVTPDDGQALTGELSYAKLAEIEGAVPDDYDKTARWCMSKKTFASILALTDKNGQPIARVDHGIGGKPERTIFGREVVVSARVPKNKTFVFDFGDYTFNTIYDMGIAKKQDWDTEDHLTKAVMSVDGKVVDKSSLVIYTISENAEANIPTV